MSRAGVPNSRPRLIVDDHGTCRLHRRCCRCRTWLPQDISSFTPRLRDPETRRVTRWDSRCRPCVLAAQRARHNALPDTERTAIAAAKYERAKADPDEMEERRRRNRAYARRVYAENPDAMRAKRRAYHRRLMQDPERHARELETRRIAHRLRAERDRGVSVGDLIAHRDAVMPTVVIDGRLPAAPLGLAVREAAGRFGSIEVACADAGVAAKTVSRWVGGHPDAIDDVTFDVADQVVTRLDLAWWTVWTPEDDLDAYERAAGLFGDPDAGRVAA